MMSNGERDWRTSSVEPRVRCRSNAQATCRLHSTLHCLSRDARLGTIVPSASAPQTASSIKLWTEMPLALSGSPNSEFPMRNPPNKWKSPHSIQLFHAPGSPSGIAKLKSQRCFDMTLGSTCQMVIHAAFPDVFVEGQHFLSRRRSLL